MDKRIRSPNYPALSLPDAIEKVTALYRNVHTHAGPREVIAKGMGFNSLNGASATAISALHKYGLLEKLGDDIKVSERALRILHPNSAEEKAEAIREAAFDPPLFGEIAERFPGRLPNEELLRNYLVRKGFVPAAAQTVLLAYRETSELVERSAGEHDSGPTSAPETQMVHPATHVNQDSFHKASINQGPGRQLGRYDFEGGAFVQILAGGNIDTEAALDMIETLLKLKRAELKAKPKTSASSGAAPVLGEDSVG